MKCMITGGSGFIGSAVIRYLINHTSYDVLNVDKLTYAGNIESVRSVSKSPRYSFSLTDICDFHKIKKIYGEFRPNLVMHLAAETHVDRSIDGSFDFIQSNIVGTYTMIESARLYWRKLHNSEKKKFRFHHISTDEVYGSLGCGASFTEETSYNPSSPYSASKAGSDHLVRAWGRTYGLPIVVSNCSNNYGPYQFPEKLVPVIILNAINGDSIPVYGNGEQIRDWLYVDDHALALIKVALEGEAGETYNIGGCNEMTNNNLVRRLCSILDKVAPNHPRGVRHYSELITYVKDRPGHDQRYSIDSKKIHQQLGWKPEESFSSGMEKTVQWYLMNKEWCSCALKGYQYKRLGTSL